ncbi:Bro-N domain-containing protein, partial [Clostridioides difficile]
MFEEKKVEVLEYNGQVLFNPYDCGRCLELSDSAIRNHLSKMNDTQAVLLKNSNVLDKDFRKLHNTGEKFLTESGVYKLIFKSKKEEAERFQDWISDEVLPAIRQTGAY